MDSKVATPFYISEDDPPAKRKTLEAALKLFVNNGLCETTIRDVAAVTGYSNPALYKHFKSKEELMLYLFERCYDHMYRDLQTAMDEEDNFYGKLRAFVTKCLEIYDESPESLLYVQENVRRFWPHINEEVKKHSLIFQMQKLIQYGVDEGAISQDANTPMLAMALSGILLQFSRVLYFGDVNGPASDWVEPMLTLLRRTLS